MDSVIDGTHPDLINMLAELDRRRGIQLEKVEARKQYVLIHARITARRHHQLNI